MKSPARVAVREMDGAHHKGKFEMPVTETLKLLDKLQDLGFNDAAFARLHHKRLKRQYSPHKIEPFRTYLEQHERFMPNSENELVHKRLAFILKRYRDEGFPPGKTDEFVALAEVSFIEIPPYQIP